jgi:hypothetical protein
VYINSVHIIYAVPDDEWFDTKHVRETRRVKTSNVPVQSKIIVVCIDGQKYIKSEHQLSVLKYIGLYVLIYCDILGLGGVSIVT